MSNICTESVPELVSSFARNRQSYVYKEHLDIVTSYYSALLGVHPVLILASFFFLWLMLQNLHFWKYWLVCASCADHMHGQRAVHTVDEETNVWPWFVGNQNRAWNADKAVGTCEKLGYLTVQITRFYDYHQTWPIHSFEKPWCTKECGIRFSSKLTGWEGKLPITSMQSQRNHGDFVQWVNQGF